MAAEDGERWGLKRKPTGPPRLLLGRTRTRSAGQETKPNGEETSAPAGNEDELTCRGRQSDAGKRRRRRWWRRFSSAVVCVRRHEEDSPPEGALENHEESRKTEKKMRNILRRSIQQRPDRKKSPPSFQTKLQKFFIRAGKRRSVPLGHVGDLKVEEDPSGLTEPPGGHPEVQMFPQQTEHQDLPEEPEPPPETPEDGSETIQTVHITQVLVRDVSSEEDEVLFDSELVVDLHDQPPFELPSEEKTVQMFRPPQPSTNGPSIRIELYPPDDTDQEEEEDEERWEGVSSSENHLLHLICVDHSERQLLQTARSLVRTAVTAAVDQLTREQQSDGSSAHQEPRGCR